MKDPFPLVKIGAWVSLGIGILLVPVSPAFFFLFVAVMVVLFWLHAKWSRQVTSAVMYIDARLRADRAFRDWWFEMTPAQQKAYLINLSNVY